jgi:hypothetical protein
MMCHKPGNSGCPYEPLLTPWCYDGNKNFVHEETTMPSVFYYSRPKTVRICGLSWLKQSISNEFASVKEPQKENHNEALWETLGI